MICIIGYAHKTNFKIQTLTIYGDSRNLKEHAMSSYLALQANVLIVRKIKYTLNVQSLYLLQL